MHQLLRVHVLLKRLSGDVWVYAHYCCSTFLVLQNPKRAFGTMCPCLLPDKKRDTCRFLRRDCCKIASLPMSVSVPLPSSFKLNECKACMAIQLACLLTSLSFLSINTLPPTQACSSGGTCCMRVITSMVRSDVLP